MVSNRPGKIQSLNSLKSHGVKFKDRLRNCEDVILEEGLGIALLSCDPGRDHWNTVMGTFLPSIPARAGGDSGQIWIYDYATPNLPDSDAPRPLELTNYQPELHPLGIDFHPETSTLYVIDHSRTLSPILHVFHVSIPNATATHVQTYQHPLLHTPNSVHILGPGKLLMSKDHIFRAAVFPFLSKLETFARLPGGTVVYVDLQDPSEPKALAHVPLANGVKVLNSTTVAVASSTRPGVYLYSWDPDYSHGCIRGQSLRRLERQALGLRARFCA